ncbi:uncharacterized protein [Rutidosis leptorrhynchoides]|uniref:uncharacterized protein n=1 Tax=Rutidosis leptorrhynchoides TaxID=125765 RepID=UPI003A9A0A2E
MIERYCAKAKETRTKIATEITLVTDKFVLHISDYPITTPPIVPATMGVYSGLTDPLDFLQRFEGVVSTYNWDEPVACRVFSMVLQGLAREWFHNSSARSIAGFIDLQEKFLLQFQNLLPQKKTHIRCHDIKQGFKEMLGGLLTRYVYECQKTPNLQEDQKISSFVHAINQQKHTTLVRRLRRYVPQTFAKVMQEAYDYIRCGEDSNIMQNCFQQRNNNGGYQRNDRQRNNGDNEATTQGKLNHLLTDKANSTDAMIAPCMNNTPKTPNVNATVQQERKAPAVKNLGAKFVGKKENLQEIKVINMGQIANITKKRKAEEVLEKWQFAPITFPLVQHCELSEEPVIISCKIADSTILIQKVHIDTGSSVDVIYEQLSLSGFSGKATWPLGQLESDVELTDEVDAKRMRKAILNLYVMRYTSRFNILLGCTALCKLGVIPSTIHGMVKFTTCKGIATVKSAESEPMCALVTAQENWQRFTLHCGTHRNLAILLQKRKHL